MSSTRRAKDDSVFHQGRFASSPEFERGLLANLIAKRCALLDDPADRELIWFIQYLSHRSGGLAAVVGDLVAKYPDRIQTSEMFQMNLTPQMICSADQVRKLRNDFNGGSAYRLKGERFDAHNGRCEMMGHCPWAGLWDDGGGSGDESWEREKADAQKLPVSYPAKSFFADCLAVAKDELGKWLCELCPNPESSLTSGPWYFPRLVETLREYKAAYVKEKSLATVVTSLGEKVYETLDYTAYGRGLTLMQGEARTGKSFAARAWCDQHPGQARYIEVPPSNDECSFFQAMARGLGLGNFLNYKMGEIRNRVESVLLNGDILLVLDEAQRLWPQKNYRYGFPSRVIWAMAMANAGVPIAMVSTSQFIQTQRALEKNGWNSAQLTGRIRHFESLPMDISVEDLMAVGRAVLPEADRAVLKALAIYARNSARYLAAVDSIASRARYIAKRNGREAATTDDVRKAMQESVIPSDSKLQIALATGKKSKDIRVPASAPEIANSDAAQDSQLEAPTLRAGTRQARPADLAPLPSRGNLAMVLSDV